MQERLRDQLDRHPRAVAAAVAGGAVVLVAFAVGLAVAVFSAAPPIGEASPVPTASTSSSATPKTEPSPNTSASIPESPAATSSPTAGHRCAGNTLLVDCFARVTVDVLNLRTGPSLDAPQVFEHIPDAPKPFEVQIGRTNGRDHVYIADGPRQADGLAWYQVGVMNNESEQSTGPLYLGWVASGDGTDPWLVAEDLCPPAGSVELADLTFAQLETAWAIHLGCFGDQVLTLRGWFPELPPDFEISYDTDGSCFAEPAFLICSPFNKFIRTGEGSFYGGNDYLNFTIDPATGVELPERGQWIEITGAFDHPAAQECGTNLGEALTCRDVFVATDISVTE